MRPSSRGKTGGAPSPAGLRETQASRPGENGSHLLQLYLERCYKLADEDYLGLQKVDETIREMQESGG